jgi:hypothetical protein
MTSARLAGPPALDTRRHDDLITSARVEVSSLVAPQERLRQLIQLAIGGPLDLGATDPEVRMGCLDGASGCRSDQGSPGCEVDYGGFTIVSTPKHRARTPGRSPETRPQEERDGEPH